MALYDDPQGERPRKHSPIQYPGFISPVADACFGTEDQ